MIQQVIQITNLTPEQFSDAVRGAVRSELASYGVPQPPPQPQPDYLTRTETASLLRISLVTLHKLSNKGVLQSLKLNGQVRYRRVDVVAAIAEVTNGRYKR